MALRFQGQVDTIRGILQAIRRYFHSMTSIHRVSDTRKELDFHLSEDRLKLFVSSTPGPDAAAISDDEILNEVRVIAPLHLIESDVIKDLTRCLRRGEAGKDRRVAKGNPPIDGRDGKLVWIVRRFQAVPDPKEGESRFSDFFHLGLFENVRNGQEIARLYKPKPGKAGEDAVGKPLAAKNGKPLSVKLDKSVTLKSSNRPEGFDVLCAASDGYVREEQGKISVHTVLEIPHHLDYSVGHVDFIGDVIVRGDVNIGFNIKAKGDITIYGSALGENILVSEKGIEIKGFHQGGEKAALFARTKYKVSVAHHVRAEVHGPIFVQKEALDCQLRTSSVVDVRNGILQGGCVWSVHGIEAKELGNNVGLATRVEIHTQGEISQEFENLQANVRKHELALAALELHLGPYALNRTRVAHLQGAFKDKIMSFIQKYDRIYSSLKTLRAQAAIIAGSTNLSTTAKVSVVHAIHAGVALVARKELIDFKKEEGGPITYKPTGEDGGWVKVAYEQIELQEENETKRSR